MQTETVDVGQLWLRLGQRLSELRRGAGLSQCNVADRIGWYSPTPVRSIEEGRRPQTTRRDLLAYLGAIGSEDADVRRELIGIWQAAQP